MLEQVQTLLPKLRQAIAEPSLMMASRAGLAAELLSLGECGVSIAAELAEPVKGAQEPVDLAVGAAKAMRLLMQAVAAQASETGADEPRVTSAAKRKERRQLGLKKGQAQALAAAKKQALPILERPVESLPRVGPASGLALRSRGLARVADLIWFLPLGYRDERELTPIGALVDGTFSVTSGVVMEVRGGFRGRGGHVLLSDEATGDSLRLSWFRAPGGMVARYREGVRVRVSGTVETFRGQLSMSHPKVQVLAADEPAVGDGVVPRYSEVPGISPNALRKAILAALAVGLDSLPEAVPPDVLANEGLPSLSRAIERLHTPDPRMKDAALAELQGFQTLAHRRLAYEEFFLLEISLHRRKQEEQGIAAQALCAPEAPLQRARGAFGFELTSAQSRVVAEISEDLQREVPMRRLVQGDVGSGKTAVAMLGAAQAIAAGSQVAFMAPTEVLASQHFRSLAPVIGALGLRAELLLGGARAAHRKRVLKGLASGTVDLAIGTHALLSEGVEFNRLRLVIVDEQHRFGVAQRLRLVDKAHGIAPHLLVMTATPIPRSLTLALHGDLSCSVIDEKPAGRIAPVTRAYPMADREKALRQLQRALDSGGQAYVVCPAIEASEDQPLRTVEEAFEDLSKIYPDAGVTLLHGRLSPEDKAAAMDRFLSGEAKILVATTVIEVGVDVAAANMIVIEHAERFGMAQLHQLRGRVGRAGQRSACLLLHEASTEEAQERIRVLCESDDGFRIAEEDLRLRGPGELFGRRQSGLPGFRFGDLRRDADLLARARDAAAEVIAIDPDLELPEHAPARAALEAAFATGGGLVKEEAG